MLDGRAVTQDFLREILFAPLEERITGRAIEKFSNLLMVNEL
jgi:hypothetical protein